MTEQELCDGCKAGNREAYRELYHNYAPFLLHLIQRYVGDLEIAKDLMHDAFLSIYQKIEKFEYRGEGSLKAWLSRICLNDSLMWLRQKQRITIHSLDEELDADQETPYDTPQEETIGVSAKRCYKALYASSPMAIVPSSISTFLRKSLTER